MLLLCIGYAVVVTTLLEFLQVVQSKVVNENLERKIRANSQYLGNLEARLQHEIVKAAPLLSANLDALPTPQLQQLVNAQEEALKRARSMLVGCFTHCCSIAACVRHATYYIPCE